MGRDFERSSELVVILLVSLTNALKKIHSIDSSVVKGFRRDKTSLISVSVIRYEPTEPGRRLFLSFFLINTYHRRVRLVNNIS